MKLKDINEIQRYNLKRLMEKNKLRPVDLANLIERTPQYIYQLEEGVRNIGPKIRKLLAQKLNVEEEEFLRNNDYIEISFVDKYPIPVISSINAGNLLECVDPWPVGVSGESDPVYAPFKVGPRSFGLRVEGESMLPDFKPNDIVVVDPDRQCTPGDPCVVKLNNEVTIKILRETKSEIILCPLNTKYPRIPIPKKDDIDFEIIGLVVFNIRKNMKY